MIFVENPIQPISTIYVLMTPKSLSTSLVQNSSLSFIPYSPIFPWHVHFPTMCVLSAVSIIGWMNQLPSRSWVCGLTHFKHNMFTIVLIFFFINLLLSVFITLESGTYRIIQFPRSEIWCYYKLLSYMLSLKSHEILSFYILNIFLICPFFFTCDCYFLDSEILFISY